MVQRIIGVLLLLVGLIGLGLSIGGIVVGGQVVDNIGAGLATTLTSTSSNLDTVEVTLKQVRATLEAATQGLDTVQQTLVDAGQAASQTTSVIDQANTIVSQDVPDSLDSIQTTLPNIIAVAKTVDQTLIELSQFKVDRRVLGTQLSFDLGIDYDPPQPIDESLAQVEASLADLSTNFGRLEGELAQSSENVGLIGQDLQLIAGDIGDVSEQVAGFVPLMDDYLQAVTGLKRSLDQTQAGLAGQLNTVKLVITILMLWIGLSQLAPLYLGWELLMKAREQRGGMMNDE
jgi:hypothetical protein